MLLFFRKLGVPTILLLSVAFGGVVGGLSAICGQASYLRHLLSSLTGNFLMLAIRLSQLWNVHPLRAETQMVLYRWLMGLCIAALVGSLALWLLMSLKVAQPGRRAAWLTPGVFLVGTLGLLFVWPTHDTFLSREDKLLDASARGDNARVGEELGKGANINAIGRRMGLTPLTFAASAGDIATVRMLLERGADVNAPDSRDFTPLDAALNAFESRPEVVRLLLDKGAHTGRTSRYSSSPLCVAVKTRKVEVVTVLLDHGANVNEAGPDGRTPLSEAVAYDQKDMVLLLLSKGANPNLVGGDRETPLATAAGQTYHKDCVELCQILLDAGADVNAKDKIGDTALMRAAHGGHVGVVRLLLSKGADPNARTKFGVTPLYEAVSVDNGEVVKALVEGGADMNLPSLGGQTPLQMAREGDKDNALDILDPVQKSPVAGKK